MHQQKYFTSNFFINEIFSVEKFPNCGSYIAVCCYIIKCQFFIDKSYMNLLSCIIPYMSET